LQHRLRDKARTGTNVDHIDGRIAFEGHGRDQAFDDRPALALPARVVLNPVTDIVLRMPVMMVMIIVVMMVVIVAVIVPMVVVIAMTVIVVMIVIVVMVVLAVVVRHWVLLDPIQHPR